MAWELWGAWGGGTGFLKSFCRCVCVDPLVSLYPGEKRGGGGAVVWGPVRG